MKNKILITGINGFLGSHLARILNLNYEVIGLENSNRNRWRLQNLDIKIYSVNETSLDDVFLENNFNSVIHCATVYGRLNYSIKDLIKTNIELPVQLFELCNKYEVKLFLNTDTFFNNPNFSYAYLSEYTTSKRHCLEWLKNLNRSGNCKLVNMKIFHMYGENDSSDKFIPTITEKLTKNVKEIKLTTGQQTRDFIYISDVICAYEHVIEHFNKLEKFENLDLGTGQSHSVKDFVLTLSRALNSSSKLRFGYLPYREGEIMKSEIENTRLFEIGWEPKFNLVEGIDCYLKNLLK